MAAYDKLNSMIGKSRKSQRRRAAAAKHFSLDKGIKPWNAPPSRLSPIEFEGSPNLDTIMSAHDTSHIEILPGNGI